MQRRRPGVRRRRADRDAHHVYEDPPYPAQAAGFIAGRV
ncbi:hypothetical protein I549_1734 [Mycobacterium avium subsp. avium 2285 (R)]|nr:hypothetical protein I549_1734 [Mycobacterium avium subsp. avium 2285 (R)]